MLYNKFSKYSIRQKLLFMQIEDTINVTKLNQGSYRDYTILYNRYFAKLYGFIFGLIRSHSIAEEIVQETFVKIWMIRESIKADQSFQSYLFTIAKNKLLTAIRDQTSNKQFFDFMEFSNSNDFSDNGTYDKIDFDHFNQKIASAKSNLTPRQLEIFELNIEKGFSTPEIALKLSISERTIQNQLSIALKLVRELLSKMLIIILLSM